MRMHRGVRVKEAANRLKACCDSKKTFKFCQFRDFSIIIIEVKLNCITHLVVKEIFIITLLKIF